MPDLRVKFTAAGVALKAPSFGRRFYTPMILASLFLLTLFTRTYRLYSFPYFPEEAPWLGLNPVGLYRDEVGLLGFAADLFDTPTLYAPPLFLLLQNLSVKALGSTYAVRVPSTIASSLIAVLIYLVSMRKFGSRGASIASALYFIAMFPAFIYNRMAFLENGVALLLLVSYYCLLVYEGCAKGRWLYLSGLFAALAALSKINGLVAPLFFAAYSLHKGFFKNALKPVFLTFAVSIVFPLMVLLLMGLDPSAVARQWWIGMIGKEISAWEYFIISSMPSGWLMWFIGYLRPEYWYIFAYFALAYLAVKEYEKVSDVILLIVSFVGLCLLVWGVGSYYIIIVQPFLAIPVGYAIMRMLRMPPQVAMMFILFIYAPMAMTFNIAAFGEGTYPRIDLLIYLLKLLSIGVLSAPAFYLLIKGHEESEIKRTLLNGAVIGLFLTLLLIGSYLTPAFYPHYLNVGI